MRITYVVHQFFPRHFAGTERVVLNLAKQMQRMGHSVRVLTYGIGDEVSDFTARAGAVLYREYVYQGVPVLALRYEYEPRGFGQLPFPDDAMADALEQLLPKYDCDVMHSVHPMTLAYAPQVARDHGIPVVATFTDFWIMCPKVHLLTPRQTRCFGPGDWSRCTDGTCFGPEHELWIAKKAQQASRYLELLDEVVAPSDFVVSMLTSNGYGSAIRRIRHGVDYRVVERVDKRYQPDTRLTFGYIGTILYTKGVVDLVEAYRDVTGTNTVLQVYGPMAEGDEYQDSVRAAAGDDERIRFLGRYEYDEVGRILRDIDVVVVPSTMFETSSLVMALALASGIPVITQNIGAPAELVKNDVNGYVFTPGDVPALTRIMQHIVDDPPVLNRLRHHVTPPPRIEEEAFEYEQLYWAMADRAERKGADPVLDEAS